MVRPGKAKAPPAARVHKPSKTKAARAPGYARQVGAAHGISAAQMRGAAGSSSSSRAPRGQPQVLDEDDEVEEDDDYEENEPGDEPGEEYNDDDDDDATSVSDDGTDVQGEVVGIVEETVDALPEEPTTLQVLKYLARSQAALVNENAKQTRLITSWFQFSHNPGAAARPPPKATPPRGRSPAGGSDRSTASPSPETGLVVDGVRGRKFGHHRIKVAKVLAAEWYKKVGARGVRLPPSITTPIAMRAFDLDPNDVAVRDNFEASYRSEISQIVSKVKQVLSETFFLQLLVLKGLPAIEDASSPSPPHMVAHKTAFGPMRAPPAGFDGGDTRYKYMAAWHAAVVDGELRAFEDPIARKLLDIDFFARAKAKGMVPPTACKWNLGSLAYFLLYTQQRLTIKQGANGVDVYGNMLDGNDTVMAIESICNWLMDPVVCPTEWPTLLTIRAQNPHYGEAAQPTTA